MMKKLMVLLFGTFLKLALYPALFARSRFGHQKILDRIISLLFTGDICLKYYSYEVNRKFDYKKLESLKHLNGKMRIGIVFQGPINRVGDFTFRTVRHYLTNYPDIEIVLSTWKSEEIKKFQALIDDYENFSIVQSETPKCSGVGNINLQITSTKVGLEILDHKSVDYVLKIRTDQCLFDEMVFLKLISVLQNIALEEKIIFITAGSFLLRLYGPSDFIQFGKIEKIKEYWSAPLEIALSKEDFQKTAESTPRDFSMRELCEVYLGSHYLRLNGEKLMFTLQDSLKMHQKYFYLISEEEVGFFWDKYTFQANKWTHKEFPHPYLRLSEPLIAGLLANPKILEEFDSLLDVPFEEKEFS